ncbi:MAG: methylamine methyltransferase corrinoid protein reductive activase [Methylococcaceae bacterium]|nr:methylamine methyltransferase corrinoid protein reductive activase [Methylococcaceae bacterium]
MARLAVAMDLGTSGLRAQAMDLASGEVLSTAMTTRHPLPGANVIDHIHFALELGVATARDTLIASVNQLIGRLRVATGDIERLAVCGNPTQLSLFQGMEIRDLAFAGSRKLQALGVTPPERQAAVLRADQFPALALPRGCLVIIPPAVRHEIGADALALILQTGILECGETAIAIDYGTNAEMALVHQGHVYTGSAAAGPALEGQHIACGTLAIPGAVADLEAVGDAQRLLVLDGELRPVPGSSIDLCLAKEPIETTGPRPIGITGTGTIAAVDQALEAGIITLPHIRTADRRLHFGRDLFLTEADLAEAGKAIGAIRAGYITLSAEAGIVPGDIRSAYLAGASGTYVDARKSRRLGLIPPHVQAIRQVGNTSLAMARDLALAPEKLDAMTDLARELRQNHCMFGLSKTFATVFILELSYWTEGMPISTYRDLLRRHRLPDLPPTQGTPRIIRTVQQDIDDLGRMGLVTLDEVGLIVALRVEGCIGCAACVRECPADALSLGTDPGAPAIALTHALCNGVACRRCEQVCPEQVLHLNQFFGAATNSAAVASDSHRGQD